MDDKRKKYQAYVLKLETELHELEQREEAAIRKMQLWVYPATVAFIILSAYGFYLVSSLTKDVSRMANLMATMSNTVETHMSIISTDTVHMSNSMAELIDSTQSMNQHVADLTLKTKKMSQSVRQMSMHTGYMQQDLWSLNKHISKPFNMFNIFIPWRTNNSNRHPIRPYPYRNNVLTPPIKQHPVTEIEISSISYDSKNKN